MTHDDAETGVCDNCTQDGEVAFTLTTNVEGGGTVEAKFCSSGCLKEWTAAPSGSEPIRRPHPRVRSRRARTY